MVTPVNPVSSMGDLIIDEGMQRSVRSDAEKQRAFDEFLVEQVFLKDMFSQENSIYKPDPEDEDNLVAPLGNSLYGELAKKQIARYMADSDLFNTLQNNAAAETDRKK